MPTFEWTQHIFTHVDIRVPQNATDVNAMYDIIRHDLAIPETAPVPYEVVIDIGYNHNGILEHRYYLSCWEQRDIVWIEDVDIQLLSNNDRKVYGQVHLSRPQWIMVHVHIILIVFHRICDELAVLVNLLRSTGLDFPGSLALTS